MAEASPLCCTSHSRKCLLLPSPPWLQQPSSPSQDCPQSHQESTFAGALQTCTLAMVTAILPLRRMEQAVQMRRAVQRRPRYGHGHLSVAYLHYRLRTLYHLCGEGAPHPDERPDQSREKQKIAVKRQRPRERSEDDAARDRSYPPLTDTSSVPARLEPQQQARLSSAWQQ